MDQLKNFDSHRTPLLVKNACASSNHTLATRAGLEILQCGGNAADAAVAIAAALTVTEPTSTSMGGDAFCMFYNSQTKTVCGINGSGHSPAGLTLELLKQEGFNTQNPLPRTHPYTVTVPGTVAAWVDTVHNFGSGKLTLNEILAPAISLAENGFPVTPVVHNLWKKEEDLLKSLRNGHELLLNGKAPRIAEIMTLPTMATKLKEIATKGKEGFYTGRVAEAIVDEVKFYGGVLSLEDLAQHTSKLVTPISTQYKNFTIWEIPPNGLGITALIALNILEAYDLKGLGLGTAEYLHLLIESLKLSFADSLYFVSDPEEVHIPVKQLLHKQYAVQRRTLISQKKANDFPVHGNPEIKCSSDTVYITVVDKDGNACSFIDSCYKIFGTGIVPKQCGFAINNRGMLFSLDPSQPNVIGPKKRPQHTIIPGMMTDVNGNLLTSFGIMGGFMQPQAHIQVLLGMMEFGLDPQEALNLPRFYINITNSISLLAKSLCDLEPLVLVSNNPGVGKVIGGVGSSGMSHLHNMIPLFTLAQEGQLDSFIAKLQEALQNNEIRDISTSAVMELPYMNISLQQWDIQKEFYREV